MAITAQFAATMRSAFGTVSAGDASRTLPVNVAAVFTPGVSGSRIDNIDLVGLGNTIGSMLRLWIYDGTNYHLWAEIPVLAATPNGSSGVPVWSAMVSTMLTVQTMPLVLPSGYSLRASVNDTQLVQDAALASIASAQTTSGTATLLLNGTNMTAASAAAIAVAAAPSIGVPMTLTSTPYVLASPGLVSITSASNLLTVGYRIIGRSMAGALQTELLTGPNATTVFSANIYKAVTAVIPNATNGSAASVGYSYSAGSLVLPQAAPIMLSSGGNLSAINFTLTGMSTAGAVLSEVLAGPNVGEVVAVNSYLSIFNIAPSAAVGTNIQVGTPPILSGIKVIARGGDF